MHKMPRYQLHPYFALLLTVLFFSQIQIKICSGFSFLEPNSAKIGESGEIVKRICTGKTGEGSVMEVEEGLMDSEINRRIMLMQKRYISYDTLRRDLVPCDRPGVPYYNCKGAGVVNTYNRGCEVITRCARGG